MIANLKLVEPVIFRGGQPENDADWDSLVANGVTQVIKLNSELLDEETAACKARGITLMTNPISLEQQIFGEPDLQAIKDCVGFIGPGTFIHCEHGQDRTGLVVGSYRRLIEGWDRPSAWQEMLDNGFHPILFGLVKAWFDL